MSSPADEILVAILLLAGFLLFACLFWPRPILRGLLWLLTHTIYRLRVMGLENIPAQGGALLVCNHVSYIDWLLLLAAQKRSIRFVVWTPFLQKWGFRRLMRWARVIPIDGSSGPRALVQSLRQAGEALAQGDLVCIFAEGGLTRTGFLLPFHRGLEQIVKKTPAPIVPVCLDHVWGSIFSYHRGKLLWKWPVQLPYPVDVAFGAPLPPTISAAEVRLAIQKLSADCAVSRSPRRRAVHRQFIRAASRHPFRPCVMDSMRKLSYAEALAGALMLTRWLRPQLGDDRMVALWLPPSAGGAIANIALAFLGKTSVNLNYTSSPDAIESSLRQCAIRRVITSEAFLHRMPFPGDASLLLPLEQMRDYVTRFRRISAWLTVVLLPSWVLDRCLLGLHRQSIHDVATVIFSSGSTGDPKGVELTHNNVAANAESMIQAIDVRPSDRLLGILPFFHSFGYTVTIWVPLQMGASVVYHPDPRQAKKIGELCHVQRCTIFLTTPTFLRFCVRQCEPNEFATLRILVSGAEKLPPPLAQEFQEKFGVLPLEGYGCTELSPVVASNVPDKVIGGVRQVGNKPGTIGQPLPGIAARIVNPDTLEPVPIGQDGLLLIYGGNVMKGYLGRPDLTGKAIHDGWYITGDMARFDEDGFITITGRLARFAKVGGEMVPLEKIEEELHDILGTSERICAVAAIPDVKRGERLVVLHLPLNGTDVHHLCEKLGHKGLPNLWLPGERDFFQVPELPILGSGKLDLKRLKEMALERVKG